MNRPLRPALRAFTLIELLVVISILAILMTLLFPAVSGAMENAKKTQAKNAATQIATAIVAYNTEYGTYPGATTGSDVTDANEQTLWDTLMPPTGTPPADNPRGITFLELPTAKSGKNGLVNGKYMDPWGQEYKIAIDGNYDNAVAGPNGDVRKTVIVWSTGTPKNGSPNTEDKKFVKSWE